MACCVDGVCVFVTDVSFHWGRPHSGRRHPEVFAAGGTRGPLRAGILAGLGRRVEFAGLSTEATGFVPMGLRGVPGSRFL